MTRPWQASASSVAPPMQVPWIAATNGLPQVSSRRKTRDMPARFVEQLLLARPAGSLASSASKLAKMPREHGDVGAAGKILLAGGDDRALDRRVAGDLLDDRLELVHHREA